MPFSLTDFIGDRLNSYGLDVERRDQPHRTRRRRPGPVQIVLPQRGRRQGRARRQSGTFEDSSGDEVDLVDSSGDEYEFAEGRASNRGGSWDSSSRGYIPGYYGRGVGARGSGRSQGRQQYQVSRHSPTNSYSPYENVNVETRSRLARPSTSGGYPSSSSSRSYSHSPYEGVNVETRSPYPGQSSYRRPRIHYAPDHTLAYATYLRENPYAGVNMEERVPYEDQRHHESRHQPRERDTRRVRFAD